MSADPFRKFRGDDAAFIRWLEYAGKISRKRHITDHVSRSEAAPLSQYRLATLAPAPTKPPRIEFFVLNHQDISDPLDRRLTVAVKVWIRGKARGTFVTIPSCWYAKIGRLRILASLPGFNRRGFGFERMRQASQSDPLAQRKVTRLSVPCLTLWWVP